MAGGWARGDIKAVLLNVYEVNRQFFQEGGVVSKTMKLALDMLMAFFKREKPHDESQFQYKVNAPVPDVVGDPTASVKAHLYRVDKTQEGQTRILTIVDCGVGVVLQNEEEEELRLMVLAWALKQQLLREPDGFRYDELRVRRLDIIAGGPETMITVGDGHMERAEVAVARAYKARCAREHVDKMIRRAASGQVGPTRRAARPGITSQWHKGRERAGDVTKTEGTTIVRTAAEAAEVIQKLRGVYKDRVHAVDTEVRNWKPGQTPHGNGEVICFSVYCGDDVDFGTGPRLWVDNLDERGNNRGLMEYFREYIEDAGIRKVFHNYSFDYAQFGNEGLSVAGFSADTMHMARLEHSDREEYSLEGLCRHFLGPEWCKRSLKEFMAEEKATSVEDLHLSDKEAVRKEWIDYSTFDTVATWKLHQCLENELKRLPWTMDTTDGKCEGTMLDFYGSFWRPLGEALVGIEARGIPISKDHLKGQEGIAEQHREDALREFKKWLQQEYLERYPNEERLTGAAEKFNLNSNNQLRHLLFGEGILQVGDVYVGGLGLPEHLAPARTKKGAISIAGSVIKELVGRNPPEDCGTALGHIGAHGCQGLGMILRLKDIGKNVGTFLHPLQEHMDKHGRVHTSLNLRTSTGRLSSSNPNMQQIPALGKDVYNIRKAVRVSDGRKLIVADYGQMEMRVLAHMSGCTPMIEALRSGTDIHSSAAWRMYEHVRSEVGDEVALVKDRFPDERKRAKAVNFGIAYGKTKHGLAQDLHISEDEAQQTIDDWYKAFPEVKAWQDRMIEQGIAAGECLGLEALVRTLRGRYRRLKYLTMPMSEQELRDLGWRGVNRRKLEESQKYERLAARRQAINAPVQGGAADIVNEAMIRAHLSEELRRLGYQMVLSVHDELIFEGPEESSEEAFLVVKDIMEHPFIDGWELSVPLPVDAKVATSWAEGK